MTPAKRPSTRTRQTPIQSLDDLQPDPLNANRGTDRGREALRRSLHTYGAGRSIVIDTRGRILGGHKTVEQAKHLGLPITVVPTTGQELVVVQRMDLDARTDPRARELALADNRVAELDLDWDPAVLRQLEQAGVALEDFLDPRGVCPAPRLGGTGGAARRKHRAGPAHHDHDPARRRVPTRPPPPRVRGRDVGDGRRPAPRRGHPVPDGDRSPLRGELSAGVSAHRPIPGSAPPWGGSPMTPRPTGRRPMRSFPGDVAYVWHAALFADVVMAGLRQAQFEVRSQVIWAKPTFVLGRGAYHWQHEPAWFAVRQGRPAPWYGGRAQSTVWEVPNLNAIGGSRTGANTPTGHATQKPVRVFEIPILNHTTAQDAVYDPFVGSGTTLIAGETLGRPTYAMDVDPIYVEVARRRWEAFTGQTAVHLAPERAPARRRRRAR